MSIRMRPARIEDVPLIATWASDTFEWGDYVPDRLPGWIEDGDSEVLVCVDPDDHPVAVNHTLMLSETEGWTEAARVHPDHKRSGMGSAMNDAGVAWARARGARVMRLATEEHNVAARTQVERLGYRATSSWWYSNFDTAGLETPDMGAQLRPAPASDVDAAWMFWSTSDLFHRGRGLIAFGWRWRRATPTDLSDAVADGTLYQSPAGWVIAEMREVDWMRTLWMTTTPDEAPPMLQQLLALAKDNGAAELSVKTPKVAWMGEALARAGGEPSGILVYTLPLPG